MPTKPFDMAELREQFDGLIDELGYHWPAVGRDRLLCLCLHFAAITLYEERGPQAIEHVLTSLRSQLAFLEGIERLRGGPHDTIRFPKDESA